MGFKLDDAYVEIVARMDTFADGLNDALNTVKKWGASAGNMLDKAESGFVNFGKKVGNSMKSGMAAVGSFFTSIKALVASGAIAYAVKQIAEWGGDIVDLSTKTGFQTEALGQLQYVAEQTGASLGDLQNSVRTMARFLGEASSGSKEATGVLAQLGLTMQSCAGMSAQEKFMRLIASLGQIADPLERAALAQSVFGRGAMDLIPIMDMTTSELQAMVDEATNLGLALDMDKALKLDQLDDSIGRFKGAFKGLWAEIVAALAPSLSAILDQISTEWVPKIRKELEKIDFDKWAEEIWGSLDKAFEKIRQNGDNILKWIKSAIEGVGDFLADPIGKAKEWLSAFWAWLKETAGSAWEWIKQKAIDAWGQLSQYIQERAADIRQWVENLIPEWMKRLFNGGAASVNVGSYLPGVSQISPWARTNPPAANSPVAQGSPVVSGQGTTVNVAGTAGESPETFAKRVAQAVVDAQRMGLGSAGMLAAV